MRVPPERPLRILLAKLGLDTHTVGITVVAHALREAGMEVIFTGLKQSADAVASAAIQEDVDVVGISSLSAGHTRSLPRLAQLLREQGGGEKKAGEHGQTQCGRACRRQLPSPHDRDSLEGGRAISTFKTIHEGGQIVWARTGKSRLHGALLARQRNLIGRLARSAQKRVKRLRRLVGK